MNPFFGTFIGCALVVGFVGCMASPSESTKQLALAKQRQRAEFCRINPEFPQCAGLQ